MYLVLFCVGCPVYIRTSDHWPVFCTFDMCLPFTVSPGMFTCLLCCTVESLCNHFLGPKGGYARSILLVYVLFLAFVITKIYVFKSW